MSVARITKKQNIILLVGSVFLGGLANYLFFDELIGMSYPVFVAVSYLVFFLLHRNLINPKSYFGFFLTAANLLLSFTIGIYANPILTGVNILLAPILFAASTILLTKNNEYHWYDIRFVSDIFPKFTMLTLQNSFAQLKVFKHLQSDKENLSLLTRVVYGVIVSIPLLLILGFLLASADAVFLAKISDFTSVFKLDNFGELVFRIAFILLVMFLFGGFFWSLLHRNSEMTVHQVKGIEIKGDKVMAITVLTLVNLLYLAFILVQFAYLFGGGDLSFLENYTYADYARKGFAELIAVTVLNVTISAAVMQMSKGYKKSVHFLSNILLTVLLFFSLIVLYSSHFRLGLYESAYGFTYTRVLAHLIIFSLAAFILLLGARVWTPKLAIFKVSIVGAVLLYVTLSYANIDLFIVQKNLQRFEEGKELDVWYLSELDPAAFVEIEKALFKADEQLRTDILNRFVSVQKSLQKAHLDDWRAYNYSQKKALDRLDRFFENQQ